MNRNAACTNNAVHFEHESVEHPNTLIREESGSLGRRRSD